MQNHANCVRSNTLRLRLHRHPPRFTDRSHPLSLSVSLPLSFPYPFSLFLFSLRFFSPPPAGSVFLLPFCSAPPAALSLLHGWRECQRQKCFDDCVPPRLFLYFCRGVEYRLGGAAAPETQRGMKLRPPYLRLLPSGKRKNAWKIVAEVLEASRFSACGMDIDRGIELGVVCQLPRATDALKIDAPVVWNTWRRYTAPLKKLRTLGALGSNKAVGLHVSLRTIFSRHSCTLGSVLICPKVLSQLPTE